MRAVVQRVSSASVSWSGQPALSIARGLVVLAGVAPSDSPSDAIALAAKIMSLRIFANAAGKFDRNILEAGGEVLVVSQFTLFADLRRGRRPGFTGAAAADLAEPMFDRLCEALEAQGARLTRGKFGAAMAVELCNDGPVTIVLSTDDWDTAIG